MVEWGYEALLASTATQTSNDTMEEIRHQHDFTIILNHCEYLNSAIQSLRTQLDSLQHAFNHLYAEIQKYPTAQPPSSEATAPNPTAAVKTPFVQNDSGREIPAPDAPMYSIYLYDKDLYYYYRDKKKKIKKARKASQGPLVEENGEDSNDKITGADAASTCSEATAPTPMAAVKSPFVQNNDCGHEIPAPDAPMYSIYLYDQDLYYYYRDKKKKIKKAGKPSPGPLVEENGEGSNGKQTGADASFSESPAAAKSILAPAASISTAVRSHPAKSTFATHKASAISSNAFYSTQDVRSLFNLEISAAFTSASSEATAPTPTTAGKTPFVQNDCGHEIPAPDAPMYSIYLYDKDLYYYYKDKKKKIKKAVKASQGPLVEGNGEDSNDKKTEADTAVSKSPAAAKSILAPAASISSAVRFHPAKSTFAARKASAISSNAFYSTQDVRSLFNPEKSPAPSFQRTRPSLLTCGGDKDKAPKPFPLKGATSALSAPQIVPLTMANYPTAVSKKSAAPAITPRSGAHTSTSRSFKSYNAPTKSTFVAPKTSATSSNNYYSVQDVRSTFNFGKPAPPSLQRESLSIRTSGREDNKVKASRREDNNAKGATTAPSATLKAPQITAKIPPAAVSKTGAAHVTKPSAIRSSTIQPVNFKFADSKTSATISTVHSSIQDVRRFTKPEKPAARPFKEHAPSVSTKRGDKSNGSKPITVKGSTTASSGKPTSNTIPADKPASAVIRKGPLTKPAFKPHSATTRPGKKYIAPAKFNFMASNTSTIHDVRTTSKRGKHAAPSLHEQAPPVCTSRGEPDQRSILTGRTSSGFIPLEKFIFTNPNTSAASSPRELFAPSPSEAATTHGQKVAIGQETPVPNNAKSSFSTGCTIIEQLIHHFNYMHIGDTSSSLNDRGVSNPLLSSLTPSCEAPVRELLPGSLAKDVEWSSKNYIVPPKFIFKVSSAAPAERRADATPAEVSSRRISGNQSTKRFIPLTKFKFSAFDTRAASTVISRAATPSAFGELAASHSAV